MLKRSQRVDAVLFGAPRPKTKGQVDADESPTKEQALGTAYSEEKERREHIENIYVDEEKKREEAAEEGAPHPCRKPGGTTADAADRLEEGGRALDHIKSSRVPKVCSKGDRSYPSCIECSAAEGASSTALLPALP